MIGIKTMALIWMNSWLNIDFRVRITFINPLASPTMGELMGLMR